MNSVVHFEIPADDLSRAKSFYKKLFGWKVNSVPGMDYTIVHTAPTDENNMLEKPGAINGGMLKRGEPVMSLNIVLQVEDIDAKLKDVEEHGGQLVRGKEPVGEMGFAAYIKDTEGNVIGLWENAKKS